MIYFIQEPISGLIKIGHATEPFMTRRPIHIIGKVPPRIDQPRESWATRLMSLAVYWPIVALLVWAVLVAVKS